MASSASYPRKYYSVAYADLNTIPKKEGNVIATYDADGFYYDVGNPAGSGQNVVRRKANGIEFVDALSGDDPAKTYAKEEPNTIYVLSTGSMQDENGNTIKSYSGYRWNDDLTPPAFEEVFNNLRDFQVKSISSATTQAYIVGSVSSSTGVGTLVKNPNIYLTASGDKIHAGLEGNADSATTAQSATTADSATKATNDKFNHDITTYIREVEWTEVDNATKFTFKFGDLTKTPVVVQTKNTEYDLFSSGSKGLVDKTSGVSPSATDSSGLLLTGSGWVPKGNLDIGTADKAVHDQLNQTIDTTYIKDASYDTVSEKLTVEFGDSTLSVPHTKEISIPDTTYSVFTSSADGLVPAASVAGASDMFLRGNGQWSGVFAVGSVGLVPAPTNNDTGKYLRGDHTWQDIPTFAGSTAGLVPAAQASDANKYLKGNGTWAEGNDTLNTAGSNQDAAKLYLVGAKSQTTGTNGVQTFSNANAYTQNGKLYSNNSEVVDVDSVQALTNKTSYNGYTLAGACAADIAVTLDQETTTTQQFTGDGTTTTFGPFTSTAIDIFSVEFSPDETNTYTLDDVNNTIVFGTAPANGTTIDVTYVIANSSYAGNALPTSDLVVSYVSDEVNNATLPIYTTLSDKADNSVIAAPYSNAVTYAIGDYCTHTDVNGTKLYRCKVAVSTAEEFNPLKWDEITVAEAIGKILTATLTAGSTSLTISNAAITSDSCFDIYTSIYGVDPTGVTISSGSMTLTFAAQASNMTVKVRIS